MEDGGKQRNDHPTHNFKAAPSSVCSIREHLLHAGQRMKTQARVRPRRVWAEDEKNQESQELPMRGVTRRPQMEVTHLTPTPRDRWCPETRSTDTHPKPRVTAPSPGSSWISNLNRSISELPQSFPQQTEKGGIPFPDPPVHVYAQPTPETGRPQGEGTCQMGCQGSGELCVSHTSSGFHRNTGRSSFAIPHLPLPACPLPSPQNCTQRPPPPIASAFQARINPLPHPPGPLPRFYVGAHMPALGTDL